ncbi:MAG TPA: thioredoxin domain-containing protein, partial [Mycobacterium sp.]|nr:thioredoxin domain-containing protein [Mycobacterium sp.]
DFLFKNQSSLSVDTVKEKTQAVIKDAGLNVDAFGTCFDTKAGLPAVKADQDEANALGVRSTPTFFVNGRKLEGALPYEQFKTMLDELLNPAAAGADTGRATPGAAQPG